MIRSKKNAFRFSIWAIVFCLFIPFAGGSAEEVVADPLSADTLEEHVADQVGQDQEVADLQKTITEKAGRVDDLIKQIQGYENNIEKKQEEQLTLKSQIDLLDDKIESTRTNVKKLETQLEALQLEIEVLQRTIRQAEDDIALQQQLLAATLRELYITEQKTPLEIQFSNKTFAEFFAVVEYNSRLQDVLNATLQRIRRHKGQLEKERTVLKEKKGDVQTQKIELASTQESLEGEEVYKNQLLDDTEESEEKFQLLVDKVKKEQAQIESDVASLERQVSSRVASIREELQKKIQASTSPEEEGSGSAAGITPDEAEFASDTVTFSWPITSRTITCGFHCSDYPFRRYFEHSGIDIATTSGTEVDAAASGYVAIAKSDGTSNYAYVMVVHGNGYSSVYGHLSDVDVAVDQYVRRGQAIGKSGGLPGTPGAGSYSTGAHLHFEIRVDGIPVNALSHLP